MALIRCSECGKEISDKIKKCIHCGKNLKERNNKPKICKECGKELNGSNICSNCGCKNSSKLIFIIIALIIVVAFIVGLLFLNNDSNTYNSDGYYENEVQTNERDKYLPQIEITAENIIVRENKEINSSSIGKVYSGEIYTIISEEKIENCNWYEIVTSNNIHGYIIGKDGEREYVKKLDLANDKTVMYVFYSEGLEYSDNLLKFLNNMEYDILSKLYIAKFNVNKSYLGNFLQTQKEKEYKLKEEEKGRVPLTIIKDKYILGYNSDQNDRYLSTIKSALGIKNNTQTNKPNNNNNQNTNNNSGNQNNNTSNNEEQKPQKQETEYTLSPISGIGQEYNYMLGDSIINTCRLDSFIAKISPWPSTKVRVDYTFTMTKLKNVRGNYNCQMKITLYDSNGINIYTINEYISADEGETSRKSSFIIGDASGTNYTLKISEYK